MTQNNLFSSSLNLFCGISVILLILAAVIALFVWCFKRKRTATPPQTDKTDTPAEETTAQATESTSPQQPEQPFIPLEPLYINSQPISDQQRRFIQQDALVRRISKAPHQLDDREWTMLMRTADIAFEGFARSAARPERGLSADELHAAVAAKLELDYAALPALMGLDNSSLNQCLQSVNKKLSKS